MNRKLIKALSLILCVILTAVMMPAEALAYDNFNTYISTVTEITEGQTFTVTFSFSSSYAISGINADLDYDSSMLEMVGGEVTGGFSGNVGSSIIAYTTGSSTGGAFASVTFRATSSFRPGDETYVGLYDVTGTSDDLQDVSGYSCGVGISMASQPAWNDPGQSNYQKPEEATSTKASDSSLSSLSVEGFALSPAFSSSVTSYSVEIPFSVENITISATANDPKAAVTGTGTAALQAGTTTVCKVVVKAQNGSTTTYEIRASRAATASTECSLAELKVAGYTLSPTFDRNIFKYVVIAGDSLKQADITAVPVHPMANVKVMGSSEVSPGRENVYSVVCTAEDGVTTRIYTVTIITAQDYEFFLKKSYILSISKQIDVATEGVVLDLSASPVQMVPSEIFEHLAQRGSGCVVIKTKNGTLRFNAESLYEETDRDVYDLTIQLNSEHAARAAASMAKYDNFIFSTNDTEFPGSAVISLYTDFIAGQNVNVYIYDTANDRFEYTVGDIPVAEGGVVSFEIDRGGEFIISDMDTSQTEKYTAAVKRRISQMGPSGFITAGIGLLIGLAAGIIIGRIMGGKKKSKKNGPAPETPESSSPSGGEGALEEDACPPGLPDDGAADDSSADDEALSDAQLRPDDALPESEEEASRAAEEEADDIPEDTYGDTYYADLSVLDGDNGMYSVEEMSEQAWNEVLLRQDEQEADGSQIDMPPSEDVIFETAAMTWEEEEDETFTDVSGPDTEEALEEAGEHKTQSASPAPGEVLKEEDDTLTEEPPAQQEAPAVPVTPQEVPEKPERKSIFSFRRRRQDEEDAISEFEALLDEMNRGKRS